MLRVCTATLLLPLPALLLHCAEEQWECQDGYEWEDPGDPENTNCVKKKESGGGGQGAGGQTGSCVPDCTGKVCGDDGCGTSCGTCAANESCDNGACVSQCQPQCDGKECGPNACGGQCGTCLNDEVCEDGLCESPCSMSCTCNAQLKVWAASLSCGEGKADCDKENNPFGELWKVSCTYSNGKSYKCTFDYNSQGTMKKIQCSGEGDSCSDSCY